MAWSHTKKTPKKLQLLYNLLPHTQKFMFRSEAGSECHRYHCQKLINYFAIKIHKTLSSKN